MKGLILFLFLILVCFNMEASDSITHRKEFLYRCLDMEKEAGYVVKESDYLLIDTLLLLAENRITSFDTTDKEYPKNLFKEVHKIMEEVGIEGDYDQSDPFKSLLSYSLQTKKFDCDKYSFIFIAIAERLQLPIYAVLLPSHMAVEWSDPKRSFYWETTDQSERTREEYIAQFGLNKFHFSQKMYLSRMTEEDLRLCFLYNRGLTSLMLGKYEQAEKDLDSSRHLEGIYPFIYQMKEICQNKTIVIASSRSLANTPEDHQTRLNRAKAYIHLKGPHNYRLALIDLNYILSSDPQHKEARMYRGIATMHQFILGRLKQGNKNYKKAREDFDVILKGDPENYQALVSRSILHRWARNYDSALDDIETALNIRKSDTAFAEKGNILYNRGDYMKAIECYNKALELNPKCYTAIQWRGFAKLELEKRDEAAEDFFEAYYHGIMPYDYFKKYTMIR